MILHVLILIIMKKIKVNSYDSLPLEKTLTFHTVVIHIKSVLEQRLKSL